MIDINHELFLLKKPLYLIFMTRVKCNFLLPPHPKVAQQVKTLSAYGWQLQFESWEPQSGENQILDVLEHIIWVQRLYKPQETPLGLQLKAE